MISNNRLLVPVLRNVVSRRNQSAVGGPATKHVSKAEKLILGGTMVASLFVIPVWVLGHLREYKGQK